MFEPHPDAVTRRRSAITLIKAIVPLDLYGAHKRRFLSNCLWKLTEAEGWTKYDLRFRSREAQDAPQRERRHEHVYRRKRMVDRLMQATPEDVEAIVANAIGCVVTKDEHDRLAAVDRQYREIDGWERYKRARIDVIDEITEEPHPLCSCG